MAQENTTLKKALTPLHLWGIGVGLVISGEYFGWNYGWSVAGTVGLLIATIIITVLYFTFIFSFTELTTSIPKAGGPFSYAMKAFGPIGAFIAGYATLIEFLFATPAIALALGNYVHFLHPQLPVMTVAVVSYFLFTGINLLGIKEAACFSLIMTILAILELLIFMGITLPHFESKNFMTDAMSFGWKGVFAALPFAIWLYVCLEGIAMVAEEVKGGKRTIARGYSSAMITLAVLAIGVMFAVGGTAPWHQLDHLDYPLPESIGIVLGRNNQWTKIFAGIGLFGLIASFHGIIIGYSRQIFALARDGYLPKIFGKVSSKRQVPYWALLLGGLIGLFSLKYLKTDQLVIMATVGAVVMYIVSMLGLFKLRKVAPEMERPYKAPFYPIFPAIALILSIIALVAMMVSYGKICVIFFIGLGILLLIFYLTGKYKNIHPMD
ncbi:ethanolamine permease [Rhizosphaericola mali]|uniref:Ethanolamine permease n=1 Tax=Rhizosphaericola mali TaxID=2545455 RepID=A0A5P2G889_9BACT|nr:ethanolamine permease [Rhizosphaericola mali]QES87741.1 ethanolamine permease [Rhizosphaericola mali]